MESGFLDKALLKKGMEASLPEPSVKNKYFEMNPISSEEARKQLDLIDHDFMFFEIKKIMNFKLFIKGIMEVMD